MLADGGVERLRNVGFSRRRKERNGKMKRRLMRSLTPRGGSPWLQTYKCAHTYTQTLGQTHKTKHYGKTTVKAVNL